MRGFWFYKVKRLFYVFFHFISPGVNFYSYTLSFEVIFTKICTFLMLLDMSDMFIEYFYRIYRLNSWHYWV